MRGTNRAVDRTAKALGNAVNRTTTATMTQTWFVSQTGPMAWTMRRFRASALGPWFSSSQTPPPKSAPPVSAYSTRDARMHPAARVGRVGMRHTSPDTVGEVPSPAVKKGLSASSLRRRRAAKTPRAR